MGSHFMAGDSSGIVVVWKCTLVLFIVLAAEAFTAGGLNADGNALLDFKNGITLNGNVLQSWNISAATPCSWTGITCISVAGDLDRVIEINLTGYGSSRNHLNSYSYCLFRRILVFRVIFLEFS